MGNKKQRPIIIGIGTSAGGLETLRNLFRAMPAKDEFAYVVVQHLSPNHKSLMVELLSSHASMPVISIEDQMLAEGGNIYLMPPKHLLGIKDGKFQLTDRDNTSSLNFPIDLFFKELAKDQPDRAVAIILSGTGTDGTQGIKEIKEAGGMVIVQDPIEAKFNGMPLNAIATQLADVVLDVPNIQLLLSKLEEVSLPEDANYISLAQYQKILTAVYKETGVDFSHYKSNTIQRRIVKRIQLKRLPNLESYYELLLKDEQEIFSLQKDLLIGVTQFFRNPEAFKQIKEKVIPELFAKNNNGESIRIWVTACSTGEEAYSLAILIEEYKEKHKRSNGYTIFATDIDTRAIKVASQGTYSPSILSEIDPELIRKYFISREGKYIIKKELRNQIVFAQHNLVIDPPFNKLSLISCRNLLIYFNQNLQDKVFSLFQFSLNKDGFLFLGPSESLPKSVETFKEVNRRWRIYQSTANKLVYSPAILTDLGETSTKVLSKAEIAPEDRYIRSQSYLETQYRNFLEQHGPMVIFTNQYFEVLYLSGGINKILRLPENKLSFSLLKVLPETLKAPINTAVQKALSTRKTVRYQSIPSELNGKSQIAYIKVAPIIQESSSNHLALISLDLRENIEVASQLEEINNDKLSQGPERKIQLLKSSLKDTRETLMATIEELETSNEELQASNEEMMTTNEELQSANEELQSVNEELQSVNEELHTSNNELQAKILQLTEITDDMDNLFDSTDVCALFLDMELRIRKFTPTVQKYFGVLPQDIGRPLSVFYSEVSTKEIIVKAQKVIENIEEEKCIQHLKNEDKIFVRISPYKTETGSIRGVVITLANLNDFAI